MASDTTSQRSFHTWLYTRNIDDFSGLEGVVDIVKVQA
jgi:hypothetical protein